MAFNPFNWFRKHQKAFFAGLTILCMVVFIGQFGAGDPFSKVLAMFGAGRAGGPVVATLNGRKVREGDIQRMERNRKMASDFLVFRVYDGHQRACRDLLDNHVKAINPDNPLSGLREVVTSAQMRTGRGIEMQFSRVPPQQYSLIAGFLRQSINKDLDEVESIAARDKVSDDPEKLAILSRVATILGYQQWQLDRMFAGPRARDTLYFGGGVKLDDLLDFVLWLNQADKFGIKLTDDDVKREVISEAAGAPVIDQSVAFARDPSVVQFLTTMPEYRNTSPSELMDALRDEFRAVVAQGILLGTEPGVRSYRSSLGVSSSPAAATPDEFLNYFREQRTTGRFSLLTIPVSRYLDQVKDKAPESELRSRYDRYREQEPADYQREPGFKEPRRVKVEYISASPEDPYYREVARSRLLLWASGVALAGSPLETVAGVVSDPLRQEYDREIRDNETSWFYNSREDMSTTRERQNRLHLTSIYPDTGSKQAPTAVVSALGSSMGGGSPLESLGSLFLNGTIVEAQTSLRFNLTNLLASSDPQQLLGTALLLAVARPAPASEQLVEPQLLHAVASRFAERELETNLEKVAKDIASFASKTPPADYMAKFVKEYHLKYGVMPGPMTRDAMVAALKKKQDLGLAGLREAMTRGATTDKPEIFVDTLMQNKGSFQVMRYNASPPRRDEFRIWRSQDLDPRTRPYAEVKAEVETAWRVEKARRLARQEAERLSQAINKPEHSAEDALRLLKEQKQGALFELDNVARLVPPRETLAERQTEYSPYRIPEDKSEYFEFPQADLAKQLLSMKRSGQSLVVVDQPAMNYYVAVLMERNEPSLADFKSIYARTPKKDSLYAMFMAQKRMDYRRAVVEQLRSDSGAPLDKEGRFQVSEAARQRDSGAVTESES